MQIGYGTIAASDDWRECSLWKKNLQDFEVRRSLIHVVFSKSSSAEWPRGIQFLKLSIDLRRLVRLMTPSKSFLVTLPVTPDEGVGRQKFVRSFIFLYYKILHMCTNSSIGFLLALFKNWYEISFFTSLTNAHSQTGGCFVKKNYSHKTSAFSYYYLKSEKHITKIVIIIWSRQEIEFSYVQISYFSLQIVLQAYSDICCNGVLIVYIKWKIKQYITKKKKRNRIQKTNKKLHGRKNRHDKNSVTGIYNEELHLFFVTVESHLWHYTWT